MSGRRTPGSGGQESEFSADRTELLNSLWKMQDKHGYIRPEDIAACSRALNISAVEVEGVISFYHFFSRKPVGKFIIYLNNSIVSECKGFDRVKDAFETATGATLNGVDPSGQFGLFETACIGLSDLEPAALIDFYPFTKLTSLKVKEVVARLKQGATPAEICDSVPDHIRSVPEAEKTILLRDYRPGEAIEQLSRRTPEPVSE
ncbi:MAG: NAD(P)H-dependent oxidoreductase subunit E [Woeseiaceae bacterium]|nr:NAD(P)H-dependent oxidoreductase subunit E [Woeseiaceae bacterium]MDX2607027.1 NAD(P)H-dependent oxidoreductase subunit E [Woeseiaceae bacterium]